MRTLNRLETAVKKMFVLMCLALAGCQKRDRKPTDGTHHAEAPKPARTTRETKAAPTPTRPEIVTTAATVYEEYLQNDLRAKETYYHKRVRVVGLVSKVVTSGKQVHVILGVDLGRNVTMKFADKTDLANLSKDDRVIVDGTGDGTVLGNPLFKDCTLLGSGYGNIDEAFAKAKEID